MFRVTHYLLILILILLVQTMNAADVKSIRKLHDLIIQWKKEHSELKGNNQIAFFVTSVQSCALCSQSGTNALLKLFERQLPSVNRVAVIVGADEIELSAYTDLFPYTTAIVAATSEDADKAFGIEVFPTFYLVSSAGTVLYKQEDITHSMPSIDSLQKYSKDLSTTVSGPSLLQNRKTIKLTVRKVKERVPLVQLGAITYTPDKNAAAYFVDKVQNAVLKIDMSNAVIDRFYRIENKLEYWFKKDTSQIYRWADGVIDSADYWKEFQERSALTQIKSILYDSLGLQMLCRLHTGITREISSDRKRTMWQVANGLVRMSEYAEPLDVQIVSARRYSVGPPMVVLSNGDILSKVFWKGYHEGQKPTLQEVRDSAAIFGSYNKRSSEIQIATKSSSYFNEDINDENISFYPDDRAGFFGISNQFNWFFHATPSSLGEFDYKPIEPQGIWKNPSQNIRCSDCYFADGKFHIAISLENGELWLQEYNIGTGAFVEEKLMSLKKDAITQMKFIKQDDRTFSLLAKFQKKRWCIVEARR